MRKLPTLLITCVLATSAVPGLAQLIEPEKNTSSRGVYDRNQIPGHYTLGFYADDRGSSRELTIPKDATEFELWIGVTGDSTRTFSGLAMRIELPYGVELGGPIVWSPRDGLRTAGNPLGEGIIVEFNLDCAQQKSQAPVMLARVEFSLQPGINEVELTPAAHRRYGVSVELCSDERAWPKPYADPLGVTVKRKVGFWDRVKGWFQ